MLILGLDAAADLKKFGFAICRYTPPRLELLDASVLGASSRIAQIGVRHLRRESKVLFAVDAPLGWPVALGSGLVNHLAGQPLLAAPNDLFRRVTDKEVKRRVGKQSLDIGADRIARAAWRALKVLAEFRQVAGDPIPLAWNPNFQERMALVEVYPAATLAAYGAASSKYKDLEKGLETRRAIAGRFFDRAPWLLKLAEGDVNVFDAGLCVVAGADFLEGMCERPEDAHTASREGWIWVRKKVAGSASTSLGDVP